MVLHNAPMNISTISLTRNNHDLTLCATTDLPQHLDLDHKILGRICTLLPEWLKTTTISKMQNSKFSGKGTDLVGGTAYDKGLETVEDFILRSKLNFRCFSVLITGWSLR